MIARRLGVAGALALAVGLAGCGASTVERTPTASDVPLVPGAKIATQVRECDQGSRAYCTIELVVLDSKYPSSDILAHDESHALRKAGLVARRRRHLDRDGGELARAQAATHLSRRRPTTCSRSTSGRSPGPTTITHALSSSIFDQTPAMSMMLEVGAS